MSATEVRHGWGDFTVQFLPDTPANVIRQLNGAWFGYVRVYAAHVPVDLVASTRGGGLFTGVVQRRDDRLQIGGHSVTMLLGAASDGKPGSEETGPVTLAAQEYTTQITAWVTNILANTACVIQPGSIGSGQPAGTSAHAKLTRQTPKTMLDRFIRPRFRVEYRVNPDLTLDTGTVDDLYPFAAPNQPVAMRRGGRDLNAVGLEASELGLQVSYENWANRVITVVDTPALTGIATQTNPFVNSQLGGPLNWTKVTSMSATGQTSNVEAQADANENSTLELASTSRSRTVNLSLRDYEVSRRVPVGGRLWVYDIDEGLYDSANALVYRGQVIFPIRMRVMQSSWPLQPGMGVYLDNRHNSAGSAIVDLTRYVQWDDGDTTLTVGAPPSTLGRVAARR